MELERGLRVHLLGGLEIEGVPALSLGSRKARALLRRLAVARGTAVPVEVLLEVAWPEGAPVRGAEQLSVLTSRLRGVVGAERLVRGDAGYALLADWLDLTAVDEGAAACAEALGGGDPAHAHEVGRTTLALVRGRLLPEEPDAPWLEDERAAVARTVTHCRLLTAEAALASGAAWEAGDLAQRCRDEDPYDETALRLLLRALAASGRAGTALRTYLAAADQLRDELGTEPAAETQVVYLDLLREDVAAPLPPEQGVLPGRGDVLDALATAALGPLPSMTVLEGPGGIGKTTVLDRFAAVSDAVLLRAAGDRVGGALPLQPVLDALTVALRALPTEQVSAVLGPDAELLAPLLRLTEAGAPTTAAYTTLASGAGRTVLFAALEGALSRLGGGSALVLLLDDGHEADQATADLLHHCTRPAGVARLLVVVACRPAEGPEWRGRARLQLDPLDRAAVAAVVGDARADELWARSGGHPLFLVELARYGGSSPPDSVLAAVAERCAGTGEGAATLRAAAVLGHEVDLALLAEVLSQPTGVVLDRLEEGARQRLLVETGRGFAFAHQMFRDAFAAGVSGSRRVLLHQAAARSLSRRRRVDPLLLAHHALGGDDPVLAAQALAHAAAVASERYEYQQAVTLLDRAIALEDTVPRRLLRARAHLLVGSYDNAAQDADDALARGAGADGLEAAALIAYYQRDLTRAHALALRAADTASDPELAAGCLALAGRIELAQGHLKEAAARLAEAKDLATGPVRALAAVWLSHTVGAQGDAQQALDLARGPDAAAAQGQPLLEPHRGIALGRALAMLGRGADALAAFDRLAETVQRQHVTRFAGRAENYRSWVLRNLGAPEEADDATQQAWEAVGRLDDVAAAEARGHAVLDLAEGRLRTGDLDGAARWLDEAARAQLAPHVMLWRFELRRDLTLGRLALAGGDWSTAAEQANRVQRQADELEVPRFQVLSGLLSARASRGAGEPVDLDGVAALAGRLAQVAPLESWWVLADLSREFGIDRWGRLAGERTAALVAEAGPWSDRLRSAAAVTLEGLPG